MAGIRKKIGEILIEEKLITEEQLSEALETQRLTGQKVGQILVDKGFIKESVLYKVLASTDEGKIKKAQMQLKLPIIGKITTLTNSQEFSSVMSTLLDAGLTVPEALRVTSKCLSNFAVSKEVYAMAEKIETGTTLSEAMSSSKYLPTVLKEMTGVGEKSGELVKTLSTISDYYANESDVAVKAALSKLEPVMLILLAVFAGYIVVSIYMPMFTMYSMM